MAAGRLPVSRRKVTPPRSAARSAPTDGPCPEVDNSSTAAPITPATAAIGPARHHATRPLTAPADVVTTVATSAAARYPASPRTTTAAVITATAARAGIGAAESTRLSVPSNTPIAAISANVARSGSGMATPRATIPPATNTSTRPTGPAGLSPPLRCRRSARP